jgi:hypothetical protein
MYSYYVRPHTSLSAEHYRRFSVQANGISHIIRAALLRKINRAAAEGGPASARDFLDVLREVIIDRQFFALADRALAQIKNVALPDHRFDVGIAAMINVLRTAAAHRTIDRPIFVEGEKVNHAPLLFAAAPRFLPADSFACILHDLSASRDILGGINAPAMDSRGFNLQLEICVFGVDLRGLSGTAPGHSTQL